MVLRLRASIPEELAAVAQNARPREACGFLLGRRSRDGITAEAIVPTLNAAVLPGAFAIPDIEVRRAKDLAGRARLALVAVYHSHPGGCMALSEADVRALRRSPYPWLIVAGRTGESAAYWPDGSPLALEIERA